MKDQTVLFVGGYLGEILRLPFVAGYFYPLAKWLNIKIPNINTRYIQGPFYQRISETSPKVAHAIALEIETSKTELTVLAHSRGAIETCFAILNNPHLLASDNLKTVHLMSPPVGASPIARFLIKYLRHFIPKQILTPLIELSTEKIRARKIERMYNNLTRTERELFTKKVTVHTTRAMSKDQLPWFLKIKYNWVKKTYGENDGLITTAAQMGIPTNYKFWEAHHGSLLCNQLVARHPKDLTETFFQEICEVT